MKVSEVINEIAHLVGKDDLAAQFSESDPPDDAVRARRAFLTYVNAVLDELARGYFLLHNVENMSSEDGRYSFADFDKGPIRINSVTCCGKPVEWQVYPGYLVADATEVSVKYEYAPEKLGLDDDFFYPDPAVGERLVEFGAAAEYFLVCGDGAGYELWEKAYREEIDRTLPRGRAHSKIPPRRWI